MPGTRRKTILTQTFAALGVSSAFLSALQDIGYQQPTPIQSKAVAKLLDGHDLMGVAQTGTGKTAAFALPLLQRLDEANEPARPRQPKSLILAPTRELALQIHTELENFAKNTSLRSAVIFGGVGQNPQVRQLQKGVDVLVATPGRLLDLVGQGHVDLSMVCVLVLDEADRLLDMGFIRDVKRIVQQTPKSRQSLLFSATMSKGVSQLARQMLRDPIRVDVSPKQPTVEKIDQRVIMVETPDKLEMLRALLHDESLSRAIVFTRTKHGANKVAKKLCAAGISADAIHGNKSQSARQRALADFKKGRTWVLVATDIAARGLDIEGVSHVINFELPHEPEGYVHRIGRTGRAGASGVAWSLVDPSELSRLRAVEKLIRQAVARFDTALKKLDPEDTGRSKTETATSQADDRREGGSSRRRHGRQRRNQRRAA
jgi:ATP-dependent RNA helicase RhlE|tara:strand:+ start:2588 stop:3877 length:1290 start_codon:yes stop_codon:yes gene_type:complete